jgi:hypothetical protein
MNTPLIALGVLPLVVSVISGISIATTMLDVATEDVFCRMEGVRRDALERIDAGEPLEVDVSRPSCSFAPGALSPPGT